MADEKSPEERYLQTVLEIKEMAETDRWVGRLTPSTADYYDNEVRVAHRGLLDRQRDDKVLSDVIDEIEEQNK